MTKNSPTPSLLKFLEKTGNALPHPATLFLILAIIVLLISNIGHALNWHVTHPATGELLTSKNLFSIEGLHYILTSSVKNFTNFAPLGVVLVAMLGIGIAESSGFIGTLLRVLILSAPKRALTFVVVLAGILSNAASDVGYVLLIPMGGIIFMAADRHPIAGLAAAFAGVSGGFSANLILGTVDPLLSGLSEEAAHIIDSSYAVNPTANYYFMIVSTFIIAITGTLITEKITIPQLGKYIPTASEQNSSETKRLSTQEKKGLRNALMVIFVLMLIMAIGLFPANGFLRGQNGSLLSSPVLKGIVTIIFIIGALAGVVYGVTVKKFTNDSDVMDGMAESMKSLSTYIVLVFFAAQFVAWFKESNLGIILAIKGSAFLQSANLNSYLLMILFILFAAMVNMVMGSASAKWAIMAPVFVPIFMMMGYSPELSQAVYRIGDSVTNIISPMMSFFALIIAFFQKYDKKAGIGTLISVMIPYSFFFFIAWSALLLVWIYFNLPLGPGAGLYY